MSKILQDNKINKNNIIYTPNWCDDTYEFNKDKKKMLYYLWELTMKKKKYHSFVLWKFGPLSRNRIFFKYNFQY